MIKNNYKDDVFTGNRKYKMINNSDGTVSLQDVTSYQVTGSTFGASDANSIANEINSATNSIKVVDGKVNSNTTTLNSIKYRVPRVYTGLRVAKWEKLSPLKDYPWRGDIVLSQASTNDVPLVNFKVPYPDVLASVCEAINGHVYIYAEQQVSVQIDNVTLTRK